MKKIYFDNAATTATHPEVVEAMLPYFLDIYGNPGSIHSTGQEARAAMEEARIEVKNLINCPEKDEIIFTAGGTESDNLAIIGGSLANSKKGKHLVTSSIEHPAVLETCKYLEKEHGFEVTYLPVDEEGRVSPLEFADSLREDTVLASIMLANNEIGTIQPIKEMAGLAGERGVIFHTDAVQAVGSIQVDVQELGVDLLSLSGHKFNGPKGVGALYLRRGVRIRPHIHGGGQEKRRRSGTHNTPGIIGLGAACRLARENLLQKAMKMVYLRDMLIEGIESSIDEAFLNGSRTNRLPGNVNFCFPYIEGESLLLHLDLKGIAASSGSACASDSLEPSHVLLAIGLPAATAHGSLRLSLGIDNTEEEVQYLLKVLPAIVQKLRAMSPLFSVKG